MKNKKNKLFKRVTAGVMAGMLLMGNMGSVYAAESEEIRSKAKAAYDQKDYEEAKNYYDDLIDGEEATAADYWYSGVADVSLGFHYLGNEKFDISQGLMENGEPSAAIEEQKLRAMYYAGDYWYVEKYYQEAVEHGVATNYVKALYGDSLANCKQYQKAIAVYEEILSSYENEDPNRISYLNAIGNMYKNMGDYERANQYYSDILAMDGDQVAYHNRMAKMDLEFHLADVEEIVASYMTDWSNEEVANLLAEKEYYKEALAYYEKAAQEDGADVRESMANTYYDYGMVKEAASIYEELLNQEPENTAYMNVLGSIYCDGLGRYEEARELFTKVMELNPNANGTATNFGVIARKEGDLDKTTEAYENVVQMFPDYTTVYSYRIMYEKDITVEGAKAILAQCPGWPEEETMQAMMLLDTVGTSASDVTLDSYLTYYRKLLEQDSTNYYFLKVVADLLKYQGNYEEALEYYLQAKEVAGILSYYATNGLGNCYFYCGQYENAMACYEQNANEYYDNSLFLSVTDCYMMLGKLEEAKATMDSYAATGGSKKEASYRMMIAYQENDYEALLDYANQTLEETPDNVKAKAYKAVALEALNMEGVEEIIADIDSITYAAGTNEIMIAESILGRLEQARNIYATMQQLYPVDAREAIFDYEIRNLFQDPKFCEMAGLAAPISKVETGLAETAEENGNVPVIPVAAGVGIVAVLGGLVVVLKKKSK